MNAIREVYDRQVAASNKRVTDHHEAAERLADILAEELAAGGGVMVPVKRRVPGWRNRTGFFAKLWAFVTDAEDEVVHHILPTITSCCGTIFLRIDDGDRSPFQLRQWHTDNDTPPKKDDDYLVFRTWYLKDEKTLPRMRASLAYALADWTHHFDWHC